MNNRNFVIRMRPSQLPPAVQFYIFFSSSSSLLFFSFLHDDYDKCRYQYAAHSQLPFGEFTNGYHTPDVRSLFEREEEDVPFSCVFFVPSSNLTFPVEIPRKKPAAGFTISRTTHG